eukprot:TRINITY_DN8225_c0_g2_i1.p1 TRINITY_DN8225_c0_g2~~TRINITY_DN8225_c0_g2_i1.p1  ORF type:complete len:126 (+),score=11.24 TRINITY_DN8225_c0_g2_i1:428-805(+)
MGALLSECLSVTSNANRSIRTAQQEMKGEVSLEPPRMQLGAGLNLIGLERLIRLMLLGLDRVPESSLISLALIPAVSHDFGSLSGGHDLPSPREHRGTPVSNCRRMQTIRTADRRMIGKASLKTA